MDEILFFAECDGEESGGEGNVMAASMLGNPGDSGRGADFGTSRLELTLRCAGFFCCFDGHGEVGDVCDALGKADSWREWLDLMDAEEDVVGAGWTT